MPRNGSGSYSLPNNTVYPGVNGVTIAVSDWNATFADVQTALTQSVSSDGQTPMTGNLPMGGFKLTGLAAGSTNGDSVRYEQLSALLPPGVMLDYGGGSAPTGYLLCDGSAVNRTTYAALFAAIGTTWGAGDGSTTFNVPDMRRRTTVGSGGTGTATLANTVGSTGGEETHILTTAELASHDHTATSSDAGHVHAVNDPQHSHELSGGNVVRFLLPGVPGGANYAAAAAASTADAISTGSAATGISIATGTAVITTTVNPNGSGTAHNNIQPSAVVTKIIKT